MKDLFFLILLICCTVLLACKTKPEDIDVQKLETPCEYLDAAISVGLEIVNVKGDKEKIHEFSEKEVDRMNRLLDKYKLVIKYAQSKYRDSEFEACDNRDKFREVADIIGEY